MNPDEPIIETERVHLSIADIERRYPDEWVVIVDCDFPNMTLKGGVVYAHSPNRRALRSIIRSQDGCAIRWTGRKRHPFHHVEIVSDVDRAI